MKCIGCMAINVKFYFDEHMSRPLAKQLIKQGVVVIMAVDVDMTGKDDDTDHLPYATSEEAVLVTCDRPFAGRVQNENRTDHTGMVCWTGKLNDIGGMFRALVQFAQEHTPESAAGQVFWLR